MGQYNPHTPYILGQEWVSIRQADYEPDQITERGYTLRLDQATVAVSGAFWTAFPPEKIVNSVAELVNVYPADVEDQTGPIKKCVIPVSNVLVTGNGEGLINSGVSAWQNPSDLNSQTLSTFFALPTIGLNFAVENFTQELFGKRILGVRFAYTAGIDVNGIQSFITIGIANAVFTGLNYNPYQAFIEAPTGQNAVAALALITELKYVDFSDTNINLSTTVTDGDPTALALPWRLEELLLFSTTTPLASRRVVIINPTSFLTVDDFNGSVEFGYGVLEVFYCEEKRVRVGGRFTALNSGNGYITEGANMLALRDLNFAIPSALPAGEYLVTHTHREIKPTFIARAAPRLRAVRQLYQIPTHRGVVVDSRVVEGAQFTSAPTDEITTVTLHTATSIVTGSHAYGTSVGAPVYGTKTPTQEVINLATTSVSLTQVRFYARRFGDTTIPLTFNSSSGGFAVSISVEDFDELPEIVDGWREVTLNLPAVSTQTAGATSSWLWSATGESSGNQWQVLAASNPAGSRIAVQSVAATGPATYQVPLGSTLELNWMSPPISGSADDSATDAVLLFSQEPPAVTGFAVTTTSLSITGVGQFCGSDPRCVPTAIQGNLLSWTAFGVCDDFDDRTLTDQWGNASETGQLWTNTGGAAGDYDVADGSGTHLLTSTNVSRNSIIAAVSADQYVAAYDLTFSQAVTGTAVEAGVILRHADTSNRYFVDVNPAQSGAVTLTLHKQVAGTITDLASVTLPDTTHYAGASYNVIGQIIGSQLRGRAWQTGRDPVPTWQLTVIDTSLTAAGSYGVRTRRMSGNFNTDIVVGFSAFTAMVPHLAEGGQIEVQRRDPITDWQTVMLTDNPACVISFTDVEARVDQLSEYRIRTLNALDFAGPWATGSGTIPSPGVTIGGDGNSILIFTSNAALTSSLAYTMQWEGQPVEQFIFPEVDTLQLQRMFGKNFLTAFHPLERGGEQFNRTLLVNAAAVSLPSLANFRSLRDLGWADLDYVCVRDELGNRWFANVAVPEGSVRMDRTIYIVEVRVTEVTDTASPVDPSEGVA